MNWGDTIGLWPWGLLIGMGNKLKIIPRQDSGQANEKFQKQILGTKYETVGS